jgi:hypothetical protein
MAMDPRFIEEKTQEPGFIEEAPWTARCWPVKG